MTATCNNLRAATATLSGAAIILLAVILLAIRPVSAFAEGDQSQGTAEGNIQLSIPGQLPCTVKADGSVLTPDLDQYAIKNTGTVAVAIATPTVQFVEGAGVVSLSAKAAVIPTIDDKEIKVYLESANKFNWISGNNDQAKQVLEPNQSLCAKFNIGNLTRDNNANALNQATTDNGFILANLLFAYEPAKKEVFAVVYKKLIWRTVQRNTA